MRLLTSGQFLEAYVDYAKRPAKVDRRALGRLMTLHVAATGDLYDVAAQLIGAILLVAPFEHDNKGFSVAAARLFLGFNGRLLLSDTTLDDLVWKTWLGMVDIDVLAGHLRKRTVSIASDFGPVVEC